MKTRQAYYILDPQTDTKQEGDEFYSDIHGQWMPADRRYDMLVTSVYRRPVPDAVTPDDGWKPHDGGTCPVPIGAVVDVHFRDGDYRSRVRSKDLIWSHQGLRDDIIAYKVIEPAPKQPLGPDDVPPGSVIRPAAFPNGWIAIVGVICKGVVTSIDFKLGVVSFGDLAESNCNWQIKRPGEDWKPCCK